MPLTSWQAIKLMLATQEWKVDYFKVRETCSMHVTLVDTEVWFKNSLRIRWKDGGSADVKGKSKLHRGFEDLDLANRWDQSLTIKSKRTWSAILTALQVVKMQQAGYLSILKSYKFLRGLRICKHTVSELDIHGPAIPLHTYAVLCALPTWYERATRINWFLNYWNLVDPQFAMRQGWNHLKILCIHPWNSGLAKTDSVYSWHLWLCARCDAAISKYHLGPPLQTKFTAMRS